MGKISEISSKPDPTDSMDADATESNSSSSHQVVLQVPVFLFLFFKKSLILNSKSLILNVFVESPQVHLGGDGVQVEGQHVKRENAENMLSEDREGRSHSFRIRVRMQAGYLCDLFAFSLREGRGFRPRSTAGGRAG